jgi:hypothetical protein
MLKITDLMSDAQCYEKLRELRWGKGSVHCVKVATAKRKAHQIKARKIENTAVPIALVPLTT